MDELIRKANELKAASRRGNRVENKLNDEFCEKITGKTWLYRDDCDNTVTYMRVKSAKRKGYHTRLDIEAVEFGYDEKGFLMEVADLLFMDFWRSIVTTDIISRFKEISDEEFEARYAVWKKVKEMENNLDDLIN